MQHGHTFLKTSPLTFCISPNNADSKDDFPQPTWPTTATKEPLPIWRLILEKSENEQTQR